MHISYVSGGKRTGKGEGTTILACVGRAFAVGEAKVCGKP